MEIDSFRGIKHEDLKLNSKSLVLLGENGTGKSSIVNAIEYLFTSEVSLLKGSLDIDHDKAIKFFGKSNRELNVKAVLNNDLVIERNENGLNCPNELKQAISSLSNGANLLNRKKLLKFIDSQPKERYTAIGNLIGYDYLDKIEETFKKEHNEIDKSLAERKFDYTNAIKGLSKNLKLDFKLRYKKETKKNKIKNYEKAKEQYELCIEAINKRIDGKFPKLEQETNFEEYLKTLQETLNSNNKQQARVILNLIDSKNDLNSEEENLNLNNPIKDLSSKEEELNQILLKFEEYYLNSAKNASLLLNLLDNSKEYILSNNSTTCPVCKSEIKGEEICDNLSEEIDELKNKLESIEILKEETYDFIYYLESLNENYKLIEKQIELIDDDRLKKSKITKGKT